jgi:hypothetical protein
MGWRIAARRATVVSPGRAVRFSGHQLRHGDRKDVNALADVVTNVEVAEHEREKCCQSNDGDEANSPCERCGTVVQKQTIGLHGGVEPIVYIGP